MSKVNGLYQDERDEAGEKLIAAGMSPEEAHERLSSPPKGEEEPVAWRHCCGKSGWTYVEKQPAWEPEGKEQVQPLFTRPNPVSAELVEAAKEADPLLVRLYQLAGDDTRKEAVKTLDRLRAALSAHAGGTV